MYIGLPVCLFACQVRILPNSIHSRAEKFSVNSRGLGAPEPYLPIVAIDGSQVKRHQHQVKQHSFPYAKYFFSIFAEIFENFMFPRIIDTVFPIKMYGRKP